MSGGSEVAGPTWIFQKTAFLESVEPEDGPPEVRTCDAEELDRRRALGIVEDELIGG